VVRRSTANYAATAAPGCDSTGGAATAEHGWEKGAGHHGSHAIQTQTLQVEAKLTIDSRHENGISHLISILFKSIFEYMRNDRGGGNKKLADVGPWLRDKIVERFKQVKLPLTDPWICIHFWVKIRSQSQQMHETYRKWRT